MIIYTQSHPYNDQEEEEDVEGEDQEEEYAFLKTTRQEEEISTMRSGNCEATKDLRQYIGESKSNPEIRVSRKRMILDEY